MVLRNLDLSTGVLSFEYFWDTDKFTCDGQFTTETKSVALDLTANGSKKIKVNSYKFTSFSCQGMFSKLVPTMISEKLRDEQDLSKVCPGIKF